jgi:acyl-CoA synthetase (AMP-forming)/AMP-acid ligase II
LRTGDLGFLQDGHLFVTGRLKDMLIIRGRNHYPQDIEATVLQYPQTDRRNKENLMPSPTSPDANNSNRTMPNMSSGITPGSGAAFSIEHNQEERLVVVQEVTRQARTFSQQDFAAVIDAIRAAISEQHELQAYSVALIKPGSLPKTSSGKIQRQACRAAFLTGNLAVLAMSTLDDDAAVKGEVGEWILHAGNEIGYKGKYEGTN